VPFGMRDISPTQSPSRSRLSASEADLKDQPSANKSPSCRGSEKDPGGLSVAEVLASAERKKVRWRSTQYLILNSKHGRLKRWHEAEPLR
jgi:hypothetical protein